MSDGHDCRTLGHEFFNVTDSHTGKMRGRCLHCPVNVEKWCAERGGDVGDDHPVTDEPKPTPREALTRWAKEQFGVEIDRFNIPKPTEEEWDGICIQGPEVIISGDAVASLQRVCILTRQYLDDHRPEPELTDVIAFIKTIIEGT